MNKPASKPTEGPPRDVDAYLASVPEDARAMLEEMRRGIRKAAPDATESISYGMPGYKYRGRPLVYIGAARKHCSLYAITGAVMEAHRDELEGYDTSGRGTVRFPIGKPLPVGLIEKLVKARVAENEREQSR